MRKLGNPSESMGNVKLARVYREHGTKIRDLLPEDAEQSLEALKKTLR